MTNDEQLLGRIRQSLTERFDGVVDAETVARQVADCYQAMFRTASIKQFLPVMAENMAIRELLRIAAPGGDSHAPAPRVLFVSHHDAGRSQMAVALMDRAWLHAVHPVHTDSAGTEPTASIAPVVVTAMDEIGIDMRIDRPKAVTPALIAAADLVVRADESCELPADKPHLDWDLPDPAGCSLAEVRHIRDDIDVRVRGLLSELLESA